MTVPTFPTLSGMGFPTRETLWSSQEEVAFSGASNAFPNWSFPRYRFTVPINVMQSGKVGAITLTEWQTFAGFFETVKASAGQLFQFNFPDDGAVTAQSFGTGDGATTQFQLVRTLGGSTGPVYAWATASIFVNGVLKTISTDYTINAYGVVTFTTAPASSAALTWTGTYNWYCRFDNDNQAIEQMFFRTYSAKSVSFTTVKFGTA
jgi:uncharacterized protein (TIGR02217 family)